MITAQELRIGNVVKFENGELYQITGLSIHEIDYGANHIKKMFPLEISEEILLKVGFIRSSSITPLWVGADPMLIWRTEYESDELENYFEFRFGITESYKAQRRVRLDALHQLQNLYFALTGEELDVFKLI